MAMREEKGGRNPSRVFFLSVVVFVSVLKPNNKKKRKKAKNEREKMRSRWFNDDGDHTNSFG